LKRRSYKRLTQVEIEKALRECRGMVYVAAERIGCSPNNIKARIEKSPALQEVLAQSKGYLVDTAELKLAQAVQAGDLGAIKFYLQTQARDRGYVSRTEVTGLDGGPIQSEVTNADDARSRLAGRLDELAARRTAKTTAERAV
jgi:hypothetical protein